MAAGLVGFIFFQVARTRVKNSGTLAPEPVLEAVGPSATDVDYAAADASNIKDRTLGDGNAMASPDMLSTSLLPATNKHMGDDDFVGITPDKLATINFLDSGWALGRDTRQNTMRNASYDLRSEMPNPRLLTLENNSFLNSTIDFDGQRRAFEPEKIDYKAAEKKLRDSMVPK